MSASGTLAEENVRKLKLALEGFNSHDLDRAVECDSESIVNYDPYHPTGVPGKADEIKGTASMFEAFPDIQFVTEQILGDGDWVAVKGYLTGTYTKSIRVGKRTTKPTFKRFSSSRAGFHRFQDGKVVESHGYYDPRAIPLQLGEVNRVVARYLTLIIMGLAGITFEAVLMTFVAYGAGGGVSSLDLVGWLGFLLIGIGLVALGLRGLRKILLWQP